MMNRLLVLVLLLSPLALRSQRVWTELPVIFGSPQPYGLIADSTGALYMLTNQIHLSHDEGRTWQAFSAPPSIATVTTMAIDSAGGMILSGEGTAPNARRLYRQRDINASSFLGLSAFTDKNFRAVTVAADGSYYVAISSDSNALFRSTDLGTSWDTIPVAANAPLALFSFPNGQVFLTNTPQGMLRTEDGETWEPVLLPGMHSPSVIAAGMIALDSLRAAAVIRDGFDISYFYRSTDGGRTWSQGTEPVAGFSSLALIVADDGSLLVQGRDTRIYRSTDLGSSWSPHGIGPDEIVVSFQRIGRDSIIAAAVDGPYYSGDGGRSWSRMRGSFTQTTFTDRVASEKGVTGITLQHGIQSFSRESGRWEKLAPASLDIGHIDRLDDGRFVSSARRVIYRSNEVSGSFDTLRPVGALFPADFVALGRLDRIVLVSAMSGGGVRISRDTGASWQIREPDTVTGGGSITFLHHRPNGPAYTWGWNRIYRLDSLYSSDTADVRLTPIYFGEGPRIKTFDDGGDGKLLCGVGNRVWRSWNDGGSWEELPPLADNLEVVASLFGMDSAIYVVGRGPVGAPATVNSLYRLEESTPRWVVDEQFENHPGFIYLHEDLSGAVYVELLSGAIYTNGATASVASRPRPVSWNAEIVFHGVDDRAQLALTVAQSDRFRIAIVAATGEEVDVIDDIRLDPGSHFVPIELGVSPAGVYLIDVRTTSGESIGLKLLHRP